MIRVNNNYISRLSVVLRSRLLLRRRWKKKIFEIHRIVRARRAFSGFNSQVRTNSQYLSRVASPAARFRVSLRENALFQRDIPAVTAKSETLTQLLRINRFTYLISRMCVAADVSKSEFRRRSRIRASDCICVGLHARARAPSEIIEYRDGKVVVVSRKGAKALLSLA